MGPDVVIAGAGLVGMACALECSRRGLRVVLLEQGRAGRQASWAAAGMLAAHDPANPPELRALAELSLALYPAFLEQLAAEGGERVRFETAWTLEEDAVAYADTVPRWLCSRGFHQLAEWSLNPRALTAAVGAAVAARGITVLEEDAVLSVTAMPGGGVMVQTARQTLRCGRFVDCRGAWAGRGVRPAKGQMLRVHAPGVLQAGQLGNVVVRNRQLYLVPRLDGSVIIGATIEDVGFDTATHAEDLAALRSHAEALLPTLHGAPVLEQWAGLRPATVDGLPLLGAMDGQAQVVLATGHFRNGVLLAPATAHVVAQLLVGKTPAVDLTAFSPARSAVAANAVAPAVAVIARR